MFSKWAQKKAVEEIKPAGIEELESCPFCDFANTLNKSDKIFRCLNPDCMKESCRKCKEPNHLPLKCEEVEKEENVKVGTSIENKMTKALIRCPLFSDDNKINSRNVEEAAVAANAEIDLSKLKVDLTVGMTDNRDRAKKMSEERQMEVPRPVREPIPHVNPVQRGNIEVSSLPLKKRVWIRNIMVAEEQQKPEDFNEDQRYKKN